MAKLGLIHDYDLMANAEPTAQGNTCVVCDITPVRYQWSDYHGEGMCCQCGCPYQLRAGSDEQVKQGKYPYTNMRNDFIPLAREYYETAKTFVHYGLSFSCETGLRDLDEWVERAHPEYVAARKVEASAE